MDRFEAFDSFDEVWSQWNLHSSMDRFEVKIVLNADSELKFTFQYG